MNLNAQKKILSSANIKLTIEGSAPSLHASHSHVIGLAIREAVTNIVRHAQASEAKLTFDSTRQKTIITVQDNGTIQYDGTSQDNATGQGKNTVNNVIEGSGLRGIRERIQGLGGKTIIDNSTGINSSAGMRISLIIPNT